MMPFDLASCLVKLHKNYSWYDKPKTYPGHLFYTQNKAHLDAFLIKGVICVLVGILKLTH